jgi:hypothetical protein
MGAPVTMEIRMTTVPGDELSTADFQGEVTADVRPRFL